MANFQMIKDVSLCTPGLLSLPVTVSKHQHSSATLDEKAEMMRSFQMKLNRFDDEAVSDVAFLNTLSADATPALMYVVFCYISLSCFMQT